MIEHADPVAHFKGPSKQRNLFKSQCRLLVYSRYSLGLNASSIFTCYSHYLGTGMPLLATNADPLPLKGQPRYVREDLGCLRGSFSWLPSLMWIRLSIDDA